MRHLKLAAALVLGTTSSMAWAADPVRRVVIAQPDGISIVASDEMVAPTDMAGVGALHTMWGNDTAATFPDDGTQSGFETLYPPVGGFRVYIATYPAGQEVTPEAKSLTGGAELKSEGIPGMHKSDTTDFDMVLSGTVDCILSDGTVVTLNKGDTIVLNGADHAWRNTGTEDA
ncbi:hypothetical protein [Mesobacterium pallidum]|uniref:hypothetical protein n=1 Tax=Mesobacterium pallidum TaxID=2872037 RepID=UPI001EE16D8A|nr:hypothetical protein [Mesobacterium pallidum]